MPRKVVPVEAQVEAMLIRYTASVKGVGIMTAGEAMECTVLAREIVDAVHAHTNEENYYRNTH